MFPDIVQIQRVKQLYKYLISINIYFTFCKTRENFNFLKKGKMVISVKIQNFFRYRIMKRTSPLESFHEI